MTPSFTPLPDLTEVDEVGPSDEALFAELREVLDRHGALRRFGLVLLHQHFPLYEDERLVEFVNVEDRTLIIKPVRGDDPHAATAIQTQWRLDNPESTLDCQQWCYEDPATGGHINTGHQ